ncbi:hypothetical protein [Donghicola sp.]|jgi:hypothetical protein|uniref:hypothetical protein n=1 Tax=Donghicola sp. TaxID=1929294 RepID=UPI00345C37DD
MTDVSNLALRPRVQRRPDPWPPEEPGGEAGFKIDNVVEDLGVSGISTKLTERLEGHRVDDMLHAGDTLVVRWVDACDATTRT